MSLILAKGDPMGAIGATLGMATKVVGGGVRVAAGAAGLTSRSREEYEDLLRTLSEASVDHRFEAFKDIAWEDPAFGIDVASLVANRDERAVLTEADPIGAHPWYKALPIERQIEIGAYRFSQIAKVGRQFEQILIAGVMNHLMFDVEAGNPEFRYAMHEVTEETHHIQMFQEAVNRSGLRPVGASRLLKPVALFATTAGMWCPEIFFVGILGGEEPIDHMQRSILRAGGGIPVVERIMQIHIAEEARHISFAHEWLRQHWPEMGFVKRQIMTALFPIAMRGLCDIIMVPCKADREAMGIPDDVAREIWWDSEDGQRKLRDMFGDVRMLADDLGIRRGPYGLIWRILGMDGPVSRFRSEPSSAAA